MKLILPLSTFILFYLLNYKIEPVSSSSVIPCNLSTSVNLSDGVVFENGTIIKNGVVYGLENQIEDRPNGTKFGCICNIKACVRKCCPIGEFFLNKSCTPSDKIFDIPNTIGPPLEEFNVIIGNTCEPPKRRRLVNPDVHLHLDEFVLLPNGTFSLPNTKEFYVPGDYCVDYIDDESQLRALTCEFKNKEVNTPLAIGMIISMPFLLLTFIVYALLPDRNLHGTSLMCYVITLFGAYFLLVFIQLYPNDLNDNLCITAAIFCLFFFMVSFFMMNVMAIDIWWTFSGLRGFSGSRKEKERKRFVCYNSYAWGVPLLLVAAVSALTLKEDIPPDAWYNPGIARGQCFIHEGVPRLVYFYGPIAVLITTNIVLFIITAYKIKKVQKDTKVLKKNENSRRHSTYENDKQRFNLYLKIMLAMGINWSMEIISWFVNWQIVRVPDGIWYVTDFVNALYGVFIFLIFVFKRSIWRLLKKRYYLVMGKPNLAKTITIVDFSPRVAPATSNNNINGIMKKTSNNGTATANTSANTSETNLSNIKISN